MEWSRIKTIVLIILAVTNIGLLGMLVQRDLQEQSAQREARENVLLFLQENGISLEEGVLPQEMELLPQTVDWDRDREREAAVLLRGGEVQEQAWSDEIYRYYNDQGSIQFHRDGTFQGEFVEGALPLEGREPWARCQELLGMLGVDGEQLSLQAEGEESAVVCRQRWNGVPIFNHQITLRLRRDCVTSVEGRRLTGTPASDAGREPISIPTALVQFYHGMVELGDVCSQIVSITPGYLTSTGTGPSALTPVWQIETDTRTYRLDLLTGNLSRADEGTAQNTEEK